MYYAGIDLGLHLGYAVTHDCLVDTSGTYTLSKRVDDSAVTNLRDFFESLFSSYYPIIIGFEDVKQQHRSKAAARAFGAYWAILALVCNDLGLNYCGYGVQSIKMFAAGRGNADKYDMVNFVYELYGFVADEDEADAICISLLTAHTNSY